MRIKSNYHTHTRRCLHAEGSDRDYVESAIAAGLESLGFSDHTPWPFYDGFKSRIRMPLGELDDYFDSLSALKGEYVGRIDLHIGLEVEYFPAMFGELQSILQDYPCEYLILGQHHVWDERGEDYLGVAFTSEKRLEEYADHVVEGIETGAFLYVAHPDLPNFKGSERFYLRQARRICRAAKEANLPLEINMLGMRELRWYPGGLFFEAAAEEGNRVIIGVDAHDPAHFTNAEALEAEQDCLEFAESFGFEIVDKLL